MRTVGNPEVRVLTSGWPVTRTQSPKWRADHIYASKLS